MSRRQYEARRCADLAVQLAEVRHLLLYGQHLRADEVLEIHVAGRQHPRHASHAHLCRTAVAAAADGSVQQPAIEEGLGLSPYGVQQHVSD